MLRSLTTCAVVAIVPASGVTLNTSPEEGMSKPGAGMKPKEIKPFKDVHKDGFSQVTCALDDMLLHADKHGDNKAAYTMGDVSGVSIIRYTDMVSKLDRKPMTHAVCYEFCRTVPHMSFFGIQNGRDCYCTPYFKQAPGDSSDCDAPCDGDAATMCGGKGKSSIFAMHWCDDTEEDFNKAKAAADELSATLSAKAKLFMGLGTAVQSAGEELQAAFGKVGDSVASNYAQLGKEAAGKMIHGAEDAMKVDEELVKLPSFDSDLRQAEKDTAKILEVTAKGEKELANLDSMDALWLAKGEDDSGKLYYPAMYFVDKKFEETPQTCGGEQSGAMLGNYEECATGCNALGSNKCSGFQFFPAADKGACVFLKTVTSVRYYSGCGKGGKFLQEKSQLDPLEYKCVLKFSEFNGLDLTPDKSGKNKMSLKELKKADRCFV